MVRNILQLIQCGCKLRITPQTLLLNSVMLRAQFFCRDCLEHVKSAFSQDSCEHALKEDRCNFLSAGWQSTKDYSISSFVVTSQRCWASWSDVTRVNKITYLLDLGRRTAISERCPGLRMIYEGLGWLLWTTTCPLGRLLLTGTKALSSTTRGYLSWTTLGACRMWRTCSGASRRT